MKVLDKDVYDTMELIAEAYGGIGADRTHVKENGKFPDNGEPIIPMCLIGFCNFAIGYNKHKDLLDIFEDIDIIYSDNNRAVYKVLGLPTEKIYSLEYAIDPRRISWQDWCKELDVVRGE